MKVALHFKLQVNAHKHLNDGNSLEIRGKLHLVDLAGSECAKSSGGKGIVVKRERERVIRNGLRAEISQVMFESLTVILN